MPTRSTSTLDKVQGNLKRTAVVSRVLELVTKVISTSTTCREEEASVDNGSRLSPTVSLVLNDEEMPLVSGLKSLSTENVSQCRIEHHESAPRHRNSISHPAITDKIDPHRQNGICNLPLPISLSLGITALSDSKLYTYHSSQEFLTFLTESAKDLEETERANTINEALAQSRELKRLLDENQQMLEFVRNTQNFNPSSEIDNTVVENIRLCLNKHSKSVLALCERSKSYKNQLLLAESDLDNHYSQDTKHDLMAMNKTLSWMSMIVRYHTWGGNSVSQESTSYHSDEEIYNHHRKLNRRNGIRIRTRPQCSESSAGSDKQSAGRSDTKKDTKSIVKSSLKVATFSFART